MIMTEKENDNISDEIIEKFDKEVKHLQYFRQVNLGITLIDDELAKVCESDLYMDRVRENWQPFE